MAENKVSVELTIEQAQALRSIGQLTSATDKFSDSAKKAAKSAESSFNSFGKTVAAVASGFLIGRAVELFVGAVAKVPQALTEAARAGIEAEAATARLANALAISGDASEETLNSFSSLSDEISQLIGVEDEAVKSSLALALNLGATTEQAEKIVRTAADVSAAIGQDFNTTVLQLSQTLEGNAGRLAKFDGNIRGLSETALRSGAAIDSLAQKFAGFAQLNSGNLDVQVKNVGIAFGELEESVGAAIATSPALRALFLTLNESVRAVAQGVADSGPAVQKYIESFVLGFLEATKVVVAFSDGTARALAVVKNTFELGIGTITAGFNGLALAAEKALSVFGREVDKTAEESFSKSVDSIIQDSNDLQKAIGEDAFLPGTQAVFNFANAVESNISRVTTAEEALAARRKQIADQATNENTARLERELAERNAFLVEIASIEAQAEIERQARAVQVSQASLINSGDEIARLQELENQKLAVTFAAQEAKIRAIQDSKKREEELEKLGVQKNLAFEQAKTKQEVQNQQLRTQNLQSSLSTIATLTSSNNKTLFNIGKAAAISQATIDGIGAVQKALNAAPPPFNFVLAGLVGAASAANIAKIAAQQPPAFQDGGIVPGNSNFGDRVLSRLNSGEMVLNKSQQAELFNVANGGGGNSNLADAIALLGDRIERMNIVVQANGREIARLVRDEREAGFAV